MSADMSREAFVVILDPLRSAMRATLDQAGWTGYYRALRDVPEGLLEATVDVLLRAPLEFFPKAGEMRAACEKQRRAILALHPYEGCVYCDHSKGFRQVTGASGQMAVQVCECKRIHLEQITTLGIGTPITLLAGEPEGANEQVFPTVEQLPEPLRKQLLEQVRQRVLR